MPIPDDSLTRYEFIRKEIKEKHPERWAKVAELVDSLPEEINKETVWLKGRDKPCWSNIRVEIGERIADDLNRSEDFSSFNAIAGENWHIEMIDGGRGWKSNNNFSLIGDKVKKYVGDLESGGLKSYLWRLYAIRNFALALKDESSIKASNVMTAEGMIKELQSHDLAEADLDRCLNGWRSWSANFAGLAGRGWGIVTVYHLLTDLGLTVKPDIHLARSAICMGLIEPEVSAKSVSDSIGPVGYEHLIVRASIELARLVAKERSSTNSRKVLREVDKVMMEWSRLNLARPLS